MHESMFGNGETGSLQVFLLLIFVRWIIIIFVLDLQIVKHLPNSPNIICGTIDRDCHRERAYLFIQNCNNTWVNTKLSAGREYCCKAGVSVPCPLSL